MRVALFSKIDTLHAFADDWDRLAAGNPFRSWAWNSAWWRAYGEMESNDRCRLWTLGVIDDQNRLRGLAPWYRYQSATKGTVVSFLGSGEVCSDYLGIMAAPGDESTVVSLITDWLLDPTGCPTVGMPDRSWQLQLGRWDLLHFDGIDNNDMLMNLFAKEIEGEKSLRFNRTPGASCWRVGLAPTIETFLSGTSKNFKRRFKRAQKMLDTSDDLHFESPSTIEELSRCTEILVDLHQKRRHFLGQPGCFTSTKFDRFHRAVLPELFRAGQANIHVIFKGDTPIMADYYLLGGGIVYAYQSGIDPDYLELGPGDIMNCALVTHCTEQGMLALDFLRGDEEYKQYWQAVKRPTSIWYVAAPHWTARCRNFLRRAGEEVKATAKRGLKKMSSK